MPGLTPADPTLSNVGLQIQSPPDGGGVIVGYTGIPGNQPATFGNSVALWNGFSPVFSGSAAAQPLVVVDIPTDQQPSQVRIPYPFTGADYLVTYQAAPVPVGAAPTSMCASLQLAPRLGLGVDPPTTIGLRIQAVDATSVTIFYSLLRGYSPQSSGNWAGIWLGFPAPYGASAPLGSAAVTGDSTQGLVTISGLQLQVGFDYTVLYFMGPPTGTPGTNLGAMLTFQLTSSPSG